MFFKLVTKNCFKVKKQNPIFKIIIGNSVIGKPFLKIL